MNILQEIIAHKKEQVLAKKKKTPLSLLKDRSKPKQKDYFTGIFKHGDMAFICEVKKASPSKGIIRKNFNPVEIAKIYQENGASAISVLTDEKYFQGKLDYLNNINEKVSLPLLRKDFIIDEYQIYEALLHGASAILLIATALDVKILSDLYKKACEYNLGVLLEVHDERDLEKALYVDAKVIGINNRNLETFKTDLSTTENLIKNIPDDKFVVSESGINHADDVKRVFDAGARGVLIGEALVRENNIQAKLKQLKAFKHK